MRVCVPCVSVVRVRVRVRVCVRVYELQMQMQTCKLVTRISRETNVRTSAFLCVYSVLYMLDKSFLKLQAKKKTRS